MSEFFKKFSPNQWRRLLKNALVCALILASVAVVYGYYLVEKMGSEYSQAQLLSMQREDDSLNQQTDDLNSQTSGLDQQTDDLSLAEPDNTAIQEDKTVAVMTDNNQANLQTAETPKETGEDEPMNETVIAQPQEAFRPSEQTPISYEAVAAIASVTTAPCDAAQVYGYGYGYDPLYNDVRFHNHALYKAEENFDVLAVADGVVEKCQANEDGAEITVKHSWGLSVYAKVANSAVKEGDNVTANQKIGETAALSFSLWQEK